MRRMAAQKKFFWKNISSFVICFGLGLLLFFNATLPAQAQLRQMVRVGFVNLPYYMEVDDQGYRSGYGYECLQEVAQYANWQFEYIDGTWPDLMDKLHRGEIDLLTGVPADLGASPDLALVGAMGSMHLTLSRTPGIDPQQRIQRVGLLLGAYGSDVLEKYSQQQNFLYTSYFYSSAKLLEQAARTGEIDAVLADRQFFNVMGPVVTDFEPQLIYMAARKDNPELLSELNAAVTDMQLEDPHLLNRLYQKYYVNTAAMPLVLTPAEKAYLQQKKELVIVASPDQKPYSYFSEGKLAGIVGDVVEKMAKDLGIPIRVVEPQNYGEALDMLHKGKVDVIANFFGDYSWAESNDVRITQPYLRSRYVLLTRKGALPQSPKVACVKDYFYAKAYAAKLYPEGEILYFNTMEECENAVASGRADVTFINRYSVQAVLQRGKYSNLQAIPDQRLLHQSSMAVDVMQDPLLLHILNKELNHFSSDEMNHIVNANTALAEPNNSVLEFIYRYPGPLISGVLCIALLIVILLLRVNKERREHLHHVHEIAYKDENTGFYNRNWLEEFVRRPVAGSKKYAMVLIEVNRMDLLIDQYGEVFVYKTVRSIAIGLSCYSFVEEFAVESGAGKFICLCSYEDLAAFSALVERLLQLYGMAERDNIRVSIPLSAGIYLYEDPLVSLRKAINFAAIACSKVHNMTGKINLYDEQLQEQLHLEQIIESHMEESLETGEFQVYYQSKYNMATGDICGAEALVRWSMPELGFLNPGNFIDLFEQNGFIIPLDFYMLEAVCIMLRKRIDAGVRVVPISVNQSRLHLSEPEYLEKLRRLVDTYKIPAGSIELEITETAFAQLGKGGGGKIQKLFADMRALGFQTSIDDFGSGYSSLMLLNVLPWDTLKIDRSLLTSSSNSRRTQIILGKIIEMASELDIDVICEGVETQEQADLLLRLDCQKAQGYLYAKPIPAEQFEEELDKNEGGIV